MRVCIISMYRFPYGMAPTNRIRAYSKGLVGNGVSVNVILPFPDLDGQMGGEFEGIKYNHTYGSSKSKNKFFRGLASISRLRLVRAMVRLYYYMIFSNPNQYDCIIVSTDTISHLYVYSVIARRIKAKIIFIADEYPIPIRHKLKNKVPIWKEWLYGLVLRRYDGYVFISEALSIYYNRICPKPTHIMPVITDVSVFENIKERYIAGSNKQDKMYLCYMGNMELSKDNVDLIIRAFSKISCLYADIVLHLYGCPTSKTKEYLLGLITSMNFTNKVFLMGKANSVDVPGILTNAHILLSSQPNTNRASGGFPTKLGEYLASGKPAILTRVGENDKHVVDGEHAYFVEPDDCVAYANKLKYVIDNYDAAMVVAQNGKKLVYDKYSHIINGKRLSNFLISLP